jgi:hypothetical protein
MKLNKNLLAIGILAALAGGLAACGGSDDDDNNTTAPQTYDFGDYRQQQLLSLIHI